MKQAYSGRDSRSDEQKRQDELDWKEYIKSVKAGAYGRWEEIMGRFAAHVLGSAMAKVGKHVACPFHTPSSDGFRLYNDFNMTGGGVCNTCGPFSDGWKLLERVDSRMSFSVAVKEVGRMLGNRWKYDRDSTYVEPLPAQASQKPVESPEQIARKDERKGRDMREAWNGSVSIMDPEAEPLRAYLRGRGITKAVGPLEDLRYHPGMPYFENNVEQGAHPTFLALVRQPNGDPMTLQRGYLTGDGRKADVEKGKERKMMPQRSTAVYNGSAVRLDHAVGSVICIAEGVETALAFRSMFGLPTWATCVAHLMEHVIVPDTVKVMIIAGDKDVSGRGLVAAQKLQARATASGLKAAIYLPPFEIAEGAKTIDWNDVLKSFPDDTARNQGFVVGLRQQVAEVLASMGYEWDSALAHY